MKLMGEIEASIGALAIGMHAGTSVCRSGRRFSKVYRSRSFMKTCQAGRRRVPPW
jgi:hypothetical protein